MKNFPVKTVAGVCCVLELGSALEMSLGPAGFGGVGLPDGELNRQTYRYHREICR